MLAHLRMEAYTGYQRSVYPGSLAKGAKALSIEGKHDSSNTTYYIAPSGALVFATGSIYWTAALDGYRYDRTLYGTKDAKTIPEIQQLMKNIMDALIKNNK